MNVNGLLPGDLEVRKFITRPFYIHEGFPRTFPEPYPFLPHHGSMEGLQTCKGDGWALFSTEIWDIYTIYTLLIRISCLFVDLYTVYS